MNLVILESPLYDKGFIRECMCRVLRTCQPMRATTIAHILRPPGGIDSQSQSNETIRSSWTQVQSNLWTIATPVVGTTALSVRVAVKAIGL